jgi:basic amino acid/polyamine antiporter, APA family
MEDRTPAGLRRALNLPLLTFYGLGTIIGAGIYVLVGKVAASAGMHAPIAFVVAAAVAGLTAFAYAELSARFPRCAGPAVYVHAAFGRRWLANLVGWTVVVTAVVSAAAIANGFAGYLGVFVVLPRWVVISGLSLALGAIAAWGIGESVRIAAAITILEVGGLLLVVALAGSSLASLPVRWPELVGTSALADGAAWAGILLGAVLAFYAFIGFEDMVNVAEEVKDPSRTLPRAIFLSVALSTALYLLVALVAVLTLPPAVLAASEAPLADIVASLGHDPRASIALISLLAVTNGALIQVIMASRVIYGLGLAEGAPASLSRVHPRFHTPARATALVAAGVWVLALWFPIEGLARVTSALTLAVFTMMNVSVLWLRRYSPPPEGLPRYPLILSIGGRPPPPDCSCGS